MNNKDFEVKIKKGDNIFVIKRSDLVSCDETSDGLSFKIKNGFLLYYIDNMMHPGVKMKIKLTVDAMRTGNILIDFDNIQNPIQFFAPEN